MEDSIPLGSEEGVYRTLTLSLSNNSKDILGNDLIESINSLGSLDFKNLETYVIPGGYSCEGTVTSFNKALFQLGEYRNERLRQAKLAFNSALVSSISGILILFTGIVLMYLGYINAGIITTSGGAISEIVSLLLFKLNKQTNDRLDDINLDLWNLEYAEYLLRIFSYVKSDEDKKHLLTALSTLASKPVSDRYMRK